MRIKTAAGILVMAILAAVLAAGLVVVGFRISQTRSSAERNQLAQRIEELKDTIEIQAARIEQLEWVIRRAGLRIPHRQQRASDQSSATAQSSPPPEPRTQERSDPPRRKPQPRPTQKPKPRPSPSDDPLLGCREVLGQRVCV